MTKIKNFSNQELVNELVSRGHNFATNYSGGKISELSNFIEIPFEAIVEITSSDEKISDEFYDEHFMSVYKFIDWGDVRERAFIHVFDFISLTLRKKYGVFNPYNEEVWKVEFKE
jgi:hypothetical protein